MRYTLFFTSSLLPAPCSLLSAPCSLLPVPCSQIRCSRLLQEVYFIQSYQLAIS
ncbi:MAG: hypothetical protein F6K65_42540 [Moorea sp. SIO3C2]|nr:hypothetical protein [Moorena sp. SIO3C2]